MGKARTWRKEYKVLFLTGYFVRNSNDVCLAFQDEATRQCFDRIYMVEEWEQAFGGMKYALEKLRQQPKEMVRIDMPGTADEGDCWLCVRLNDLEKVVEKMADLDAKIKAQRTVGAVPAGPVGDCAGQPEPNV
jgi:hypothetical protein